MKSVRAQLGGDAELVTIEEIGEYIEVKLKEYDPTKEKWISVNGKVKGLSGEWMGGLGKNSHWRIPKEIEPSATAEHTLGDKKKLLIKDAVEYLDDIEKKVVIVREKLKELQK